MDDDDAGDDVADGGGLLAEELPSTASLYCSSRVRWRDDRDLCAFISFEY